MDSLQRRTDRGQSGSSGGSLMRRDSDLDLFSPSNFFSASPWQMMRRMQEDMDRLFGGFLGSAPNTGRGSGMAPFAPNMDLSEDEKEFCLEMDLPGFRPEDVDIQVRNGQLWLRAETRQETEQGPPPEQDANAGQQGQQQQRQYHRRERRYGVVQQAFALPDNVDEENIRAEFNNGVLMLHLPKQEQMSTQGRRIPIGGSGQTQPQRQIGSAEATGARSAAGAGTQAGGSSSVGGGTNPQQQQQTSQKSSK
jgi:HSP20 family protein